MRVSPPKVFPEATGAARPPAGSGGSPDAFRQTGFVLGGEVDAVLLGLEVEATIAAASAGARFRTQPTASGIAYWSRSWLCRLQALHAVQWGNYTAALPLVRVAADYDAAALALLESEAMEWRQWLDEGGISLAPGQHATEFRLHAFRSAETLAAHPGLGAIYRIATDLSLPHFGATLLLAGSDSSPERIAVTFGDRDFHLGLAEMTLGWLLALGVERLEAVSQSPAFAGAGASEAAAWLATAQRHLARADRCSVESVEVDGERRYLLSNWRRTPGGAPKKILL